MTNANSGSVLAELRARTALRSSGLDPTVPLERATSVTNEVWLTPTHVVRVNRRHDNRLAREAIVAAALPAGVGYPVIVARGGRVGEDWLISERRPGTPLAHRWPDLTVKERRRAVRGVAERLAALHTTRAPVGLPPVERAPQLLAAGSADPAAPVVEALERAARLDHVDAIFVEETAALVRELTPAIEPFTAATLVHGDVTFENVLWGDGDVTALLDVEWARPGPRDLDLDIVLRCCAHPQLHVGAAFEARTIPEDYVDVPLWLAEDYPALFAHPRQVDRLRLYAIAYEVRELLAWPPEVGSSRLDPLHPYHRLERVVRRHSYLDDFAQRAGLVDPTAPEGRPRRRP